MMPKRRWVLASPVEGKPQEANFSLEEFVPVVSRADEVLVRLLYHTVAPGVRAKLGRETYAEMVRPGDMIPGMGVGVIMASNHSGFAVGDLVSGELGWATQVVVPSEKIARLDKQLYQTNPLYSALNALGPAGLTAYFGLLRVAQIKPGDVVLISSAAGSVGSMAGQIARIHGCKVVGIVGSDAKCRDLINIFKFNGAINYQRTADLDASIRQHCPEGVDVYFDNVGGALTDAAIRCMKVHGRIAVCGQTSDYNAGTPRGWRETTTIITRRLKLSGFILFDFKAEMPTAIQEIAGRLRSGELVDKPTIVDGIERAADAFVSLFHDSAPGRLLIRVDPDAY